MITDQTTNRVLSRALGKIKPFDRGKLWCGFLRPDEFLELINSGSRAENVRDVKEAQRDLSQGISRPLWYYFYPTNDIRSRLK